MDEVTRECLKERYSKGFRKRSEYVVITDLRRVHMHRVYIFKYAREAFEQEGLTGITLMDLRHDFIVRQLEQHNKAYVAKISGMTITSLDATISKYVEKPHREKATEKKPVTEVDTLQVSRLILQEGASPVGVTLWMTWKQKLAIKEIAALTWDNIDFDSAEIDLDGRRIPMDETIKGWLLQIRAERKPEDDPHVLLTPKSRCAFDVARLSRIVRNAMIKVGLDQVTLRDLMIRGKYEEMDTVLLRHAAAQGYVTREDAMEILHVGEKAAWNRLRRLMKEGRLIRIGTKYYQTGTVVPPEQQYEVSRTHLENVGGAYRQELAELLHVESRQCGWILNGLVKEGKLKRTNQWYTLPIHEVS